MGTWAPGPGATAGADSFSGDATGETADGLAGDDTLYGNGGDDTLIGGDGADVLVGSVDSDDVFGGDGDDIMIVHEGDDASGETYDGGVGTDVLLVDGSVGLIGSTVSFERLTFVVGSFGVNAAAFGTASLPSATLLVTGSALVDIVQVNISPGDTSLSLAGWTFSSWTDVTDHINVFGTTLDNNITGSSGTDWLMGDDGADVLLGGAGADQLSPSFDAADGDADEMSGGAGNDLYGVFEAIDGVFESAGEGTDSVSAWISYTLGPNVENLQLYGTATVGGGNSSDNTITGNDNDNSLFGQGGSDFLSGGAGADTISGGIGIDTINGGAGNDTINWNWNDGTDTVDGGADSDVIIISGNASANVLNASWDGSALTSAAGITLANIEYVDADMGDGTDWLIYSATAAVVVDLSDNFASGFEYVVNVERVIGGSGNDIVTGDGLDNRLDGGAGNDSLGGGGGIDTLLGGDGNDFIFASAGNDSLQGQNGDDTFNWTWLDGRDTFNGGADSDTLYMFGSDVAEVADVNWNGSDITGLLNNALIDIEVINLDLGAGGTGGDWLRYNTTFGVTVRLDLGAATGFNSITAIENVIGGSGNDFIHGYDSANKLNGAAGDDTITGGLGNDNIIGGLGNDTFVYSAGDGADTINDFDAWAVGGQDLIDITAFGITAGDFATRVAIIDVGSDTVVRIDNDVFITLKNVTGDGDNSISSADFLLA